MPRHTHVSRELNGAIRVVINGVVHIMTDDAFIAFMESAINVLQALAASRTKPKGGA